MESTVLPIPTELFEIFFYVVSSWRILRGADAGGGWARTTLARSVDHLL